MELNSTITLLLRNKRSSFRYIREQQTQLYPWYFNYYRLLQFHGSYWQERPPLYALLLQKVNVSNECSSKVYWPGDSIICI